MEDGDQTTVVHPIAAMLGFLFRVFRLLFDGLTGPVEA